MASPPVPKLTLKGKAAGRLAAVQALFQLEHSEGSSSTVIMEFLEHRFKGKKNLSKTDLRFFRKLVEGAWAEHPQNDEMIYGTLKPGWTLDRIEPVTRAILRAALFELRNTKTPSPVIIDEYLNITHNFFDKGEVAFVNGVLNTISHKIRDEE